MIDSIKKGSHIYVGTDDSNHAGTNKKGEIIVATFSIYHEDSIVKSQTNRREASKAYEWVRSPGRDYLFTILADERSRRCGYNLVLVAPLLVKEFLKRHQVDSPLAINLYFDGPLRGYQRRFVREDFPEHAIHVDGFDKKDFSIQSGKKTPRILSPNMVSMADTLAHDLYVASRSLEQCLTDSHMTSLVQEEMTARDFRLRNGRPQ
ncbi:MAG: hypothetical protein Q8Q31_02975 [Nanoarchaeota archaeon]|nr:hypothetical protein [Nanoarchaeota archaeon]